mgnify:CR=1 FL=1
MKLIFDVVKFDEKGLVPAIVQDAGTGEVLMLAYMNRESLEKSIETGKTHFWSRSRNKLWMKGEASGHVQYIRDIYFDCDGDTLLIKVDQIKEACHTGHKSCFYRKLAQGTTGVQKLEGKSIEGKSYENSFHILQELYDVVLHRRNHPVDGSYTNYLFDKGIDKILKKVGEEASEVIIASKNRAKDEVVYETADLLYHIIVLLVEQDVTLDDIYFELMKRREKTKK